MKSNNVNPGSILIIDDDREVRESLVDLFRRTGWETISRDSAVGVKEEIALLCPDVIVTDVRMPELSGLDLLRQITDETGPPVILISAHGDIPMAVEAMQLGAYFFFEKPYDPRQLLQSAKHAAEQYQLTSRHSVLESRLVSLSNLDRVLVGDSEIIANLRKEILELARFDMPVMILGETGTGKELVARALHDISDRSSFPFTAVNCAAIPPDNFDLVMFGNVQGKRGFLSAAEKGTIFLDEISSFPKDLQVKILRVIEDSQFYPIGAVHPVKSNIRFLSSTNSDINELVSNDILREDLIFRLNNITLTLPPLRARKDDILILFKHYLSHYAVLYESSLPDISSTDISYLLAHQWPGNVRELMHVAERTVLSTRKGMGSVSNALNLDETEDEIPYTLRKSVAAFEREIICKALQSNQGKMDAVAEALGIGRRTLNDKIVKLDIDKSKII